MIDNTKRIELIKSRIQNKLNVSFIEVIDDSARHKNHAGAKTGKGHFILKIKADELNHLSRIKAHQKIYACLNDLFETDIHALNIYIEK